MVKKVKLKRKEKKVKERKKGGKRELWENWGERERGSKDKFR